MPTRTQLLGYLAVTTLVALSACGQPKNAVKLVVPNGLPTSGSPSLGLDPAALDFGKTIATTTRTKSVAVTNNSGGALTVTINPVQGTDNLLFATTPGAGAMLDLADQETKSISVTYAPQVIAAAASQASFSLQICVSGDGCQQTVSLQGQSVAPDLVIAPSPLAFGFVLTQNTSTQNVMLTNNSSQAVHLTADPLVATLNPDGGAAIPGVFSTGATAPANGAEIAAGQSLQIPLVFAPTDNVSYSGQLYLTTDDALNPSLLVALSGIGGGPSISCTPSSLDFGRHAAGIGATLQVVCTNLGQDVPGHPEASLFIPDPSSTHPGLSIQNQDPAYQAAFDFPFPAAGLAAGKSTTIDVTYNAAVQGQDTDTLVIGSNDPANPLTDVALTGSALLLPACSYQILPANGLAFGHVQNGATAILPFAIVNTGAGDCLANAFQVRASSSSAFTLPDFPTVPKDGVIIHGGDRLEVDVQFAPTEAAATFTGTVDFTLSDPNQPNQSIALTGSSLEGCLVIRPTPIDLGVAGYDQATSTYCSSGTRTVTIFNACDGLDVKVTQIQVLDVANAPEFVVTNDPSPIILPHQCYYYCPPTSPVSFQVSFKPTQAGKHRGGIQITTDDLTDPYLIPLEATATQNPTQTDSFTGHAAAVDILWVFDTDDDPNGEKYITDNLTNFLTYPIQNGIDFHMAVTSTDVYGATGSEDGRMVPCPSCKVDGMAMTVVDATGGVQAAVASLTTLMNLGSGGFCYQNCNGFASDEQIFESASEALSPALLSGYNQAFYRPDAALAVIAVNDDAEDDRSDNHGLVFYYNAFVGLKGLAQASKFSFSYVNDYGGLYGSARTAQMVELTGGVEADFSNTGTPSWTDELGALWPQLGAQLLNYPLSGAPVATTIQVTDNGVVMPATAPGGGTNWAYDPVANAIRFDPSAFPQAGDAVQISYTLACGN